MTLIDDLSMTRSEQLRAQTAAHSAHNYKPLPVVIAEAEGSWVTDVEGRRYLDMLAAYSAINFGHRHPRLVEAARRQLDKVTLVSRAFDHEHFGPFCAELAELAGMEMVLPMNSGAEAVESALKVARKWGYQVKGVEENRAEIVVCGDNFHGRTLAIVGFSTDPVSRRDFGPFAPGFVVVPYGDAAALASAITPQTVAVLVEPIQGEAGVIIPPDGYLRAVRRLCSEHLVLMVLDEIQTGLGRTGRLLAEEHEGVEADLTLVGKALSGGFYPVSAVLSNAEAMAVLKPGEHGSTFGGNPLACAVARMALRVLTEEGMIENAAVMGARLLDGLRGIASPLVRQVRGRGLMIAVELHADAGGAGRVCKLLQKDGLLCKETHEHTIRIAPPLVITAEQVDWALERFRRALTG